MAKITEVPHSEPKFTWHRSINVLTVGTSFSFDPSLNFAHINTAGGKVEIQGAKQYAPITPELTATVQINAKSRSQAMRLWEAQQELIDISLSPEGFGIIHNPLDTPTTHFDLMNLDLSYLQDRLLRNKPVISINPKMDVLFKMPKKAVVFDVNTVAGDVTVNDAGIGEGSKFKAQIGNTEFLRTRGTIITESGIGTAQSSYRTRMYQFAFQKAHRAN